MINSLKNLFYQCQFSTLIDDLSSRKESLSSEEASILCNAYSETHQWELAEKLSTQIISQYCDDESRYYCARSLYMSKKYQLALEIYSELVNSGNIQISAKGYLGQVACYLELDEPKKVEECCGMLMKSFDRLGTELKISILYVQSKFAVSKDAALDLVSRGIRLASSQNWTYFLERGLLEKARIYQKHRSIESMQCVLSLLNDMIPDQERFIRHVINQEFSEWFSCDTRMNLDPETLSVKVCGKPICLQSKPLIFSFLRTLASKREFIEREELSHSLWPHENYKPEIHDRRLHDVVRRTRKIVEEAHDLPILIISNRSGYRLTIKQGEYR